MTIATLTLVHETCCNCGVAFGMTDEFQRRRRADKKTFYCPSGHPQHYTGESDANRIKRLQEEIAAKEATLQRLADQRAGAERSALSYRRAAIRARNDRDRIKTRVHAGVCPCCNRTFQNLARHMATKHKDEK